VREAGQRYQRSRRGRFAHAARARRYRVRRQFVTHHGSPDSPADGVLQPDRDDAVALANAAVRPAAPPQLNCRFCGTLLSPLDRAMTVREAFVQEQSLLLPLPANPFPVEEQVAVKVGKTPYVRFDLNDYTVPHTHVRRTLSVRADLNQVRVFDGAEMIASHRRSYDRAEQIEDPQHLKTLVEFKREARQHRGINSLTRAVPSCQLLLMRAAERGANIGGLTTALLRLLDRYGAVELQAAVEDALRAGSAHTNTVRAALERRRAARGAPPPVVINLPEHVRRKDAPVQPHRLDTYDQLTREEGDDVDHDQQ
jgi:hypothetical protein